MRLSLEGEDQGVPHLDDIQKFFHWGRPIGPGNRVLPSYGALHRRRNGCAEDPRSHRYFENRVNSHKRRCGATRP